MFFKISLYSGLVIFGLGLLYKVSGWFRHGVGAPSGDYPPLFRLSAAVKGMAGTIAGPGVLTLLKVTVLDVILQARTFREDRYRWVMHILIYWGFMFLLLMHALGNILTVALFPDYSPTLNPFLFLRDLLGVMVIAGMVMAVWRRVSLRSRRVRTRAPDHYAILIVSLIIFSGFLLEATKISSNREYSRMVDDYASTDDSGELAALESFWVENYGVFSSRVHPPFDPDTLARGREIHEDNCAACHSPHQWAFSGYTLSMLTRSLSPALDRIDAAGFLWYVHILATFIGLALLPFSKMFHILVSPLCLLANSVMDLEKSSPANILTRQVMELDACTHCGTCSFRCSTAPVSDLIANRDILPSERMISLKAMTGKARARQSDIRRVREGVYLCTNCDRCTVVCPVGINLRELWFNVREGLIGREPAEPLILSPFSFYRGLNRKRIPEDAYTRPLMSVREAVSGRYTALKERDRVLDLPSVDGAFREEWAGGGTDRSFMSCFSCENCTTVCPVVGSYHDPQESLGLLPHQIMRSIGLGLEDLALGSTMLWDCATCYQCQEHCPQGVLVTDLLYDLKNRAVKNARSEGPAVAAGAERT